MGQLKEKYERFKQWQERPYEYKVMSDEVHHCNNCGNEFTGNFCPVCSQKAGMGRICWSSVRQGIMDIWGLGTRSLLFSIWQLLWRPGHIISDYIDGKRQVSFPPVKMLFIVAVVYSMLVYWFFPNILGMNVAEASLKPEQARAMNDFSSWMESNYSWYSLIMAVLAVVPTWVMFRYSPRHTRHSLPEGFFIQVFLAVIMVVMNFLGIPLGMISSNAYTIFVFILYIVYYFIVYKYLFGYGLWGTLWRSGFVLFTIACIMMWAVYLLFDIDMNGLTQGPKMTETESTYFRYGISAIFLLMGSTAFAIGFGINYMVTSKFRQQIKEQNSSIPTHS